jgi:hypothetical protein
MKSVLTLKLLQKKKIIIVLNQDEVIHQIEFIKSMVEKLSEFYTVILIWAGENRCSVICHPLESSEESFSKFYHLRKYIDLGHQNYLELFESELLLVKNERYMLFSIGNILLHNNILKVSQDQFSGHISVVMSSKSNERFIFEVQKLVTDEHCRDNYIKIDSLILQSGIDEISIIELLQGRHDHYYTFASSDSEGKILTQDLLKIIDIIEYEFTSKSI